MRPRAGVLSIPVLAVSVRVAISAVVITSRDYEHLTNPEKIRIWQVVERNVPRAYAEPGSNAVERVSWLYYIIRTGDGKGR